MSTLGHENEYVFNYFVLIFYKNYKLVFRGELVCPYYLHKHNLGPPKKAHSGFFICLVYVIHFFIILIILIFLLVTDFKTVLMSHFYKPKSVIKQILLGVARKVAKNM